MPNPVVFFEIVGPDGPALQRFHADTFGWTVDTTKVPGHGYLNTGGTVVLPPTRLSWTHVALFRDPAGNLTGLPADLGNARRGRG